jgi:CMP-N-acetylneuraminic acid synthetase
MIDRGILQTATMGDVHNHIDRTAILTEDQATTTQVILEDPVMAIIQTGLVILEQLLSHTSATDKAFTLDQEINNPTKR